MPMHTLEPEGLQSLRIFPNACDEDCVLKGDANTMTNCPSQRSCPAQDDQLSTLSTFEFVDELDYRNPETHKKILSAIRSRAKLDYHFKKRKAESRSNASRTLLQLAPASGQERECSLSQLYSNFENQEEKMVLPKLEPVESMCTFQVTDFDAYTSSSDIGSLVSGTWQEDPFYVYNLPNDPRAPFLVTHFDKRFRQTYTSLEGHYNVFKVNLLHPVLHHLMLYHTGAFLLSQNNSLVDEAFVTYHKSKSMLLVHDALDDPIERSSDHIIAALLFLSLYEDMYGTAENSLVHQKGLQQVLNIRKETGQRISWFLRMLLPLQDLRTLTKDNPELLSTENLNDGLTTIIPAELEISETSMWSTFHRLEKISTIISTLSPACAPRERKRVGYETGVKIERFLKILDIENPNPGNEDDKDVHRLWSLAALIFLHTIEAAPDEVYRLSEEDGRYIEELKGALERSMGVKRHWFPPAVLLWVLFFGGLHSKGKEYMWFRKSIRRVCMGMQVETWMEMRQELRGLPWVELGVEWKLKALCGLY